MSARDKLVVRILLLVEGDTRRCRGGEAVILTKRWNLVWASTGRVEIRFRYRWVARLAAWDVNRHRAKKGLRDRVEVRDGTLSG